MRYVELEDTFYFKFTTRQFSTGAPATLGGTPVLSVYEDTNATPITAGVSLVVDAESVTGLNEGVIIATAANGYEAGKYYAVVITTGTVDSVSVVGEVVHEFVMGPVAANVIEIDDDATAADNAELFFDNTGFTASNSTIGTATAVTNGVTLATGAVTAAAVATGAIDADALAADALTAIGGGVWDEDATGHQTGGTFGQAIGDPGANTETMYDAVVTDAAGTNVAADIIAVKAETATILVDTGTTLDDHLTDIKGTAFVKDTHSLTNIEGYADLIDDGTSGLAKIATDVAAILVDTADMQPKLGTPVTDVSADIASIQTDTTAIVADTNELQTDWADGGRLDNLLDSAAEVLVSGTADSGSTSTMVDAARTEADTDYWKGQIIVFTSGTISGQARLITGFTPASDTITFAPDTTQAVGTNTYEIIPFGGITENLNLTASGNIGIDWANVENPSTAVDLSATDIQLADTVTTLTGHIAQTGDTFAQLPTNFSALSITAGGTVNADAIAISASTTAADNLQLFFDGTGYNAANSTVGTVTTNTDMRGTDSAFLAASAPTNFSALSITAGGTVNADMVAISTDTTAADNLEAMYDGTGYTDPTGPASRSQVEGIGAGTGAALNFANEADNVGSPIKSISFDGAETSGTNASVNTQDGTWHQIDDAANNIDIVYQFDVGGGRTATEVSWKGRLVGTNDTMTIQAYNGSGWDTIASVAGHSNSAPTTTADNASEIHPLLSTHTGTGSDLGKVFIRLECAAQSNPTIYTDLLLVSAVNIGQTIGYANGAVWLDTNVSNTGTESFVDGTADNPVSTLAAATTIASAVNISIIHVAAGSSITLAQAYDNYVFDAFGAEIALGGQSVNGAEFFGATITGNDDGSNTSPTLYEHCVMGENTLGQHSLRRCRMSGATAGITLAEAGSYYWEQCFSGVAGTGSPKVTFGAGNQNLNLRHWSGGMQIENMGASASTDTMSIEGNGQVIEGTCTAGTVAIRGNFTISGITNLTLSDDARIDVAQINAEVDTAIVTYGLDHLVSASVAGADITDNSIIAYLVSKEITADWDDYVNTTDSLQAIRDQVVTVDANVDLILADTGTDGVVLSAAQMNSIADHVLRRDQTNARASADGDTVDHRSLLGQLSKVNNKVDSATSPGNIVVYEEDDTTVFVTIPITTDSGAAPITIIDPPA